MREADGLIAKFPVLFSSNVCFGRPTLVLPPPPACETASLLKSQRLNSSLLKLQI